MMSSMVVEGLGPVATMTASATLSSVESLPLPLSELATSMASFSTTQRMKVVAVERPIPECKIKVFTFC